MTGKKEKAPFRVDIFSVVIHNDLLGIVGAGNWYMIEGAG
jgi:hypothetical protein